VKGIKFTRENNPIGKQEKEYNSRIHEAVKLEI
jgi:hypothetical protein